MAQTGIESKICLKLMLMIVDLDPNSNKNVLKNQEYTKS